MNADKKFKIKALIDSGAGGVFIDKKLAHEKQLAMTPLDRKIDAYNADGTKNAAGTIEHCVWLKVQIGKAKVHTRFLVTGLGEDRIILGLSWLKEFNPKIDWKKGTVDIDSQHIKTSFTKVLKKAIEMTNMKIISPDTLNEEAFVDMITPTLFEEGDEEIFIRAKTSISQELAHKTEGEKTKIILPEEYEEYRSVFEKKPSERMPERRKWDHAIDLKPDFLPKDSKVYPMSPEEQEKLNEFLDENLRKGYIRPSKSPMASPFFFVAKKDSKKLRPCQDYRRLNEGTIKNAYPLPRIGDLLDKLKGAKVFTKLDLRWGYNNVRIKEGDEWKAAFKTNKGLFEPLVMFFGLCNSPATFQNMMNDIFTVELNEGWILIYMDDILIFAEDKNKLRELTKKVLRKLHNNDLFLNLEKCAFEVTEVEYLGMLIKENLIMMEPTKLAGIRDWPTPTTVKQVRSFLGFGNFYRKFIGHYADIARPLNDTTKKDLPWNWTEACQNAFDKLKEEFQKSPVLLMPDSSKPFVVESDASKWATGAVLRQQDINGEWHPCGYISHSFSPTERNYEIYDRELLAIVRALEEWRHYLQGSTFPTVILSDHKNLTFFRTAQKLNRRQARWSLFLSEFDLKLLHTPGSRMIQSDALSRRPDHVTDDTDNEDVILLPDSIFVKIVDTELQGKIQTETSSDEFFMKALLALKEHGPLPITSKLDEWSTYDGLLFFRNRCYIPPSLDLRREVVRRNHDTLSGGHPGHLKTLELVRRSYWWPGMTVFIRNYVAGCAICQQMKVNTHPSSPGLFPIRAQPNATPFSQVTCDFITDLPESDGFDSLMVVVDHGSTKGVISIPCNKTIDAEQTALNYIEHVYKRFGLPTSFLSDRGPQFSSKVFKEMARLLGIKTLQSTAYHPQTDGETERVNQELEIYFRIFCTNNPNTWKQMNALMEFCHNQRVHSVTKKSPFQLMMGFDPIDIPLAFDRTNAPTADQRLKELLEARNEAAAAHELARQKMAERSTRGFTPFQLHDKVWLDGRNLKIGYPSRKFAPKREGPFEITKVLGPVTYQLKLPNTWKIHPVFHASLLSPYKETDVHGSNFTSPPPDLIDGNEEFEVEAILGHKPWGRSQRYLVKWKGYPISEATWEPTHNLKGAQDILAEYRLIHSL